MEVSIIVRACMLFHSHASLETRFLTLRRWSFSFTYSPNIDIFYRETRMRAEGSNHLRDDRDIDIYFAIAVKSINDISSGSSSHILRAFNVWHSENFVKIGSHLGCRIQHFFALISCMLATVLMWTSHTERKSPDYSHYTKLACKEILVLRFRTCLPECNHTLRWWIPNYRFYFFNNRKTSLHWGRL